MISAVRAVLAAASDTEIEVVVDALEFFLESIDDADEDGEDPVYKRREELEALLRRLRT